MNMKTLNQLLTIVAKVQQVAIRNDKLKKINQRNRYEQAEISAFIEPTQITERIQHGE